MKKDIIIPEVKGVHVAIVKEWNEEFTSHDWNSYLINDTNEPLETALVLTRGRHADGRKTTTLRHGLQVVPAKSAKKIEFIAEEVFDCTNEFIVSYFIGTTLYDKTFTAEPYSINEEKTVPIPVMEKDGILLGE